MKQKVEINIKDNYNKIELIDILKDLVTNKNEVKVIGKAVLICSNEQLINKESLVFSDGKEKQLIGILNDLKLKVRYCDIINKEVWSFKSTKSNCSGFKKL